MTCLVGKLGGACGRGHSDNGKLQSVKPTHGQQRRKTRLLQVRLSGAASEPALTRAYAGRVASWAIDAVEVLARGGI